MSFKGFVREIDSVGRVVIPKQLRKEFGLTEENCRVVISAESGGIMMKKAVDNCAFCNSELALSAFEGQFICSACLSRLKRID